MLELNDRVVLAPASAFAHTFLVIELTGPPSPVDDDASIDGRCNGILDVVVVVVVIADGADGDVVLKASAREVRSAGDSLDAI